MEALHAKRFAERELSPGAHLGPIGLLFEAVELFYTTVKSISYIAY